MSETFSVRLAKEQFVFCSAHFITYDGDVCEPLHGHNYRVEAELHGALDENQYVVDFIAARDVLAGLVAELDHRVLLPTEHPAISVAADEAEVTATFADRRWVFPRPDCVLLPVANTTAELLARYLGRRHLEALAERSGFHAAAATYAVDECDGQWGVWRFES